MNIETSSLSYLVPDRSGGEGEGRRGVEIEQNARSGMGDP